MFRRLLVVLFPAASLHAKAHLYYSFSPVRGLTLLYGTVNGKPAVSARHRRTGNVVKAHRLGNR